MSVRECDLLYNLSLICIYNCTEKMNWQRRFTFYVYSSLGISQLNNIMELSRLTIWEASASELIEIDRTFGMGFSISYNVQ